MKTILIQIQASLDNTTFDIYTDSDSYTTPIHYNITKSELESGYTSNIVPDSATTIKISSNSIICPDQFILLPITTTTTTTTTTVVPTETIIPIYPIYNGIWVFTKTGHNQSSALSNTRNGTSANVIYDNYGSIINESISNTHTFDHTISRYYAKIDITNVLNNGINVNNISTIKFKIHIVTGLPTQLYLFDAGTNMNVGDLAIYSHYLTSSTLYSNPNILISSIVVSDFNGDYLEYEFIFNTHGINMIKDRIINNKDIVLAIVDGNEYNNTITPLNTDTYLTFNSISNPYPSTAPKLEFTII